MRDAGSGLTEGIGSAAYLLLPVQPSGGADYRSTPMLGRPFHPEYGTGFRFGAVILRRGMEAKEIAAARRLIGAIATAERAPL